MRVLTERPERAFAICHLGMRVIHRPWSTHRTIDPGERFAIHSGAHIGGKKGRGTQREAIRVVSTLLDRERGTPLTEVERARLLAFPRMAVVAVATFRGIDRDRRTGWDLPDQYHWRLSDVVILPRPVPMKGSLGLREFPDGIEPRVLEQL